MKLEFPERKALDLTLQSFLFLRTDKSSLILQPLRKKVFREEILRRISAGHSFFSVRAPSRVCGRPVALPLRSLCLCFPAAIL